MSSSNASRASQLFMFIVGLLTIFVGVYLLSPQPPEVKDADVVYYWVGEPTLASASP